MSGVLFRVGVASQLNTNGKLNQIKDTTTNSKQLQRYKILNEQKEAYEQAYKDRQAELQRELDAALVREGKKPADLSANYSKSKADLERLYNERINQTQNEYKNTAVYRNIESQYTALLNKQKNQEAKGKKLSSADQKKLDKLKSQMDALALGGTADNVSKYLEALKYVQDNQDKYNKGKLKGSAADKYDKYKAQLEAWNRDKASRITDIRNELADALKKLQTEYEGNVNANEQAIEEQKQKLWELAKEMANFQITSLQATIDMFDSMIARYQKAVDLLESTSLDNLREYNVLDLFNIDDTKELADLLSEQLRNGVNAAKNKLSNQVSIAHMYEDLLEASEAGEGFDGIFTSYLEEYNRVLNDSTASAAAKEQAQTYIDRIIQLIQQLESNDYSANDWVTEWEQGLSDVLNELGATVQEIQTFKDELREKVYFKAALDAIESLETLNSRLSSMAGIINDDWVQDESGLTEYGRAKIMLLAQEAQNAQNIVRNAAQHIEDVQAAQLNDDTAYATEAEYQKALSDAWNEYSSALQNVYSIDNEIYELSKKQQEAELKRLDKLINKRKEALANKKAYYDYDKNIRNQTKNIEALKSEIAALEDVNDAYSKSRLKQLQTQLSEAEEELQHTKDEHLYDMQINALDKLLDDYSKSLEDSAKSIKDTFEQWAEQIKQAIAESSSADVNGALQEIANFLMGGYVSVPTEQTATVSSDIANNNLIPIDSNLGNSSSLATPLSGILVDNAAIAKITSSIEKSGIDITSINTRQDEYTKQMLTMIRSINDRLDVNLSSVSDAINNKQLIANITINGQSANVTYNGIRTASGTAPSYH